MAAQAVVSARLVALMVRAMLVLGVPLSSPQRVAFAGAALPDVLRARRQSYALSVRYMRFTADRAGITLPDVAGLPEYRADAVVKVLERVTAPLEPDVPVDARVVGDNVGANLARHAQQAGRDTVQRTAESAPERIGWARTLTGKENCAFCSLLASRGPVYGAKGVRFLAHDHCDCVPELVVKGEDWDGREQYERLSDLWASSTRRKSGKAARKAFAEALASA